MTWFSRPSAARRMSLARITSKYGAVYLRAVASSWVLSKSERRIVLGLVRGISTSFWKTKIAHPDIRFKKIRLHTCVLYH
jgi:hypothetical protein